MKINLLFFACLLLFGSCTRNIQVVQIDSSDVNLYDNDVFASEDEDLAIAYDFWIEGGSMLFNVTNKTDQNIIIDFTESTFQIEDEIFYYYRDLYRYFDLMSISFDPKQMEIEPQTTKTIEGFPISYDWKSVKNKTPNVYDISNSPIKFANQLVYSFEDNQDQELTHKNVFWVSSIEKLKSKEYKAFVRNDVPKSDKYYVRRYQDQINSPPFWVSVGLEVLALFLFL